VPNLHGDGYKVRPLVITSAIAGVNNPRFATVQCVACSRSAATLEPLPAGCVLLPPKCGKQGTKLGKPTAAVAHWLVEIAKESIDNRHLAGSIARTAALAEILRLVDANRFASPQDVPPDSG
jgi:hypothetical protein